MEKIIDPIARIGAILTYFDTGPRGAGGQTMGSHGTGHHCIIYLGDPGVARTEARRHIDGLRGRARGVGLVVNADSYCDYPIAIVDLDDPLYDLVEREISMEWFP